MRFEYKYEVHSISSESSETEKPIQEEPGELEELEESKSLINDLPINTTSEKLPEQSPHWKRIDVRQKKITRGLSSLSKEFINAYLNQDKDRRKKFFSVIDKLLK